GGYQYVMGSRFQGYIEPGSMPLLHQYFGTPLTTWILNFLYGSRFSDIHCGMRGITLDALRRMDLQSHSWEYASEMVLKSVRMELRTTEVPVRFLTRCSYPRSVVRSAVVVAAGAGLAIPLLLRYVPSGFRLSGIFPADHLAIAGLLLVIGAFMNFTFTLAIHAAATNLKRK